MEEYLLLNTSVSSSLKRHVLFRGTFLAFCGAVLLLLAGIFIPENTLESWGLGILTLGGILVVAGLLPYKKISKLEMKPNQMIIGEGVLRYVNKGRTLLTVPINHVEAITFCQRRYKYGIELKVNKEKLFFPYFNQQAFEKIKPLIPSLKP
jgi:hypothetical protein